ncbi:MAG: hypothetical protein ABW061_18770 [Polyangiaceae bacterium]
MYAAVRELWNDYVLLRRPPLRVLVVVSGQNHGVPTELLDIADVRAAEALDLSQAEVLSWLRAPGLLIVGIHDHVFFESIRAIREVPPDVLRWTLRVTRGASEGFGAWGCATPEEVTDYANRWRAIAVQRQEDRDGSRAMGLFFALLTLGAEALGLVARVIPFPIGKIREFSELIALLGAISGLVLALFTLAFWSMGGREPDWPIERNPGTDWELGVDRDAPLAVPPASLAAVRDYGANLRLRTRSAQRVGWGLIVLVAALLALTVWLGSADSKLAYVCLAALLPCYFLLNSSHNKERRLDVALQRFEQAQLSAWQTATERPFVLYLRGFDAEDIATVETRRAMILRHAEEGIVAALAPHVRLVALRNFLDPGQHDRIHWLDVLDGDWEPAVRTLASRAVAIVVKVTKPGAGLSRELRWLSGDLDAAGKTLLLIDGQLATRMLAAPENEHAAAVAAAWRVCAFRGSVREKFRESLPLPREMVQALTDRGQAHG